MKFSTALVAIAAVASQAAAVQHPSGSHSVAPFFKDGVGHCNAPGGKCVHAKRAALAVAEAIAEPEAKRYRWINFCGVPGQNCNGKREAEQKDAQVGHSYFCGVSGTKGCNEKHKAVEKIGNAAVKAYTAMARREADAEAEAVALPEAEAKKYRWINFCGVPGQNCNGKRDAEAEAKKYRWINFCGVPGQNCNGKRDAEAEAEAKYRWINFCGVPGQNCNGKRDVEEVQDKIRQLFPNTEKAECFQDGQPCDLITKAHEAFKGIQAREAEAKYRWINFCGVPGQNCNGKRDAAKLKHCGREGCGPIAKAHLANSETGHPGAEKAERDCEGPSGACTLAARAIDELEDAINEGLEEIEVL